MVRLANELDIIRLMQLGVEYSKEAKYHDSLPYDPEFAAVNAMQTLDSPDACLIIAEHDGDIIGFIWGAASCLPWSPIPIAMDIILYIKPEHRGGMYGVRLIKAYEEWSRGIGCKQVSLSVASGITEEKTCKLYSKLGYQKVGQQHRKEL